MPVFRAYIGTVREARDRPHSIQFNTDSYWIGIDTFASGCMSPDRGEMGKWCCSLYHSYHKSTRNNRQTFRYRVLVHFT